MAKKKMPSGAQLVAQARKALGKPYCWGGTGPNCFDCSGLMVWTFAAFGITIPRTSEEQYPWVHIVDPKKASTGDLVFFVGAPEEAGPPGHVGMVTTPGHFIDAPYQGQNVQINTYSLFATGEEKVMGIGRAPGVTTSPGGPGTVNQETALDITGVPGGSMGMITAIMISLGVIMLIAVAIGALVFFTVSKVI